MWTRFGSTDKDGYIFFPWAYIEKAYSSYSYVLLLSKLGIGFEDLLILCCL